MNFPKFYKTSTNQFAHSVRHWIMDCEQALSLAPQLGEKEVLSMTANQVAYWRNVEQERANRADEDIRRQSLRETKTENWWNRALNLANTAIQYKKARASSSQATLGAIGSVIKLLA